VGSHSSFRTPLRTTLFFRYSRHISHNGELWNIRRRLRGGLRWRITLCRFTFRRLLFSARSPTRNIRGEFLSTSRIRSQSARSGAEQRRSFYDRTAVVDLSDHIFALSHLGGRVDPSAGRRTGTARLCRSDRSSESGSRGATNTNTTTSTRRRR